jgi:hypothetical protein
MVKIRLRPSRRSSQNIQASLFQGTNSRSNTDSIAHTNIHNDHNTHNTQTQGDHSERDTGSNEDSQNRNQRTAAQKVFHLFDSPRRALVKKSTSANKKNTTTNSINRRNNKAKTYTKMDDSSNYNYDFDSRSSSNSSNNNNNNNNIMTYEEMGLNSNINTFHAEFNFTSADRKSISSSKPTLNVMTWLHDEAPHDIIPKVLSFVGPQKHQVLSRVNKSWRKICLSEGVFRTLCEDYGKWNVGKDDEPMIEIEGGGYGHDDKNRNEMDVDKGHHFWRDLYCNNPIVPLDYPTIKEAVNATSNYVERKRIYEFRKDVRILLNPGIHSMESCIRVHIYGEHVLSIETFQTPYYSTSRRYISGVESDASPSSSPSRGRFNSRGNFRSIFTCRSTSAASDVTTTDEFDSSGSPMSYNGVPSDTSSNHIMEKALIRVKTKKQNSPIFHVTQGTLRISNISLIHNCAGIDIWNGNTVIQVQPQFFDNRPIIPKSSDKMPTAIIEGSSITSISGRGIVAIDGGRTKIRKCQISDCAATGLYVGGSGSAATVEETDIVRNGNGNEHNRRGIAQGHSGVYLEQGAASLINCNVSNNSLTGISAVSQTNTTLTVKDSDLVGNGTMQLEMPPDGSISRQRSIAANNHISEIGEGRSRSRLNVEEENDISLGAGRGRAFLRIGIAGFSSTPPAIPLF